MAKNDHPISIVPMIFARWKDEFTEMDWSKGLGQAFEVAQLLESIKAEAGAKGLAVIVQVALVPLEMIYGPAEPDDPNPLTQGDTTHEQETGTGLDGA